MILHVDMDAFYAAVEERDDPSLVGKPVIVGGTVEGRGVVAAANYEARKFGVHSAMASARAHRLCPHAVVIRPRMDHYVAVSREIRAVFERFTPLIEPLSLDVAFLDATGSEQLFGPTAEIGLKIKQLIRNELKLVASVGVAPSKFLAKIASDLRKPDGYVVVDQNRIQEFLDPLPVGRIWGVGQVTGQVFNRLGIKTIGQLRKLSVETLHDLFGSSGEHYWRLARGIDNRPVVPDREAKSISHETTFAEDIDDLEILRAWLVDLVEQVGRRLRHQGLKGRTVEIKVRFADFKTISRALTLPVPTNVTQELLVAGLQLLEQRLPAGHLPVRLLGFGVTHFDETSKTQQQLFGDRDHARLRELDEVADQIAARFGKRAIRRGAGLPRVELRHDPRKRLQFNSLDCLFDSADCPSVPEGCGPLGMINVHDQAALEPALADVEQRGLKPNQLLADFHDGSTERLSHLRVRGMKKVTYVALLRVLGLNLRRITAHQVPGLASQGHWADIQLLILFRWPGVVL